MIDNKKPLPAWKGFEAGEGGRTLDIHVGNEFSSVSESAGNTELTHLEMTTNTTNAQKPAVDEELQRVLKTWKTLPKAVRAAINALTTLRE